MPERSNEFEQLFEALQDLRLLNKDSYEFYQGLQDSRGDSNCFVKSSRPSLSHGASGIVSRELTVTLEQLSELTIHASGQKICHIVWPCSIFPNSALFSNHSALFSQLWKNTLHVVGK